MPEGHTVHRHARLLRALFAGQRVAATTLQDRFAAGARALDGRRVAVTEAHGKHLLVAFDDAADAPDEDTGDPWLHVHLGLYGTWTTGRGEPPPPKGALRVRLVGEDDDPLGAPWGDLRGPTACELLTGAQRARLLGRLGPDPLRDDADPERAFAAVARTRTSIGVLLMRQDVLSGIGNVYRAEALYRAGLDPDTPGRDVGRERWDALWVDVVRLMRAGVRAGHIVTTLPEHRERPRGAPRREDRFYVYKRTGLPCRLCGTEVRTREVAGRNLYWCPVCQAPGRTQEAVVRTRARSAVRRAS